MTGQGGSGARTFGDAAALREWLDGHGEAEPELWVAFRGVAPGREGLRYGDAAEAAASAGWWETGRRTVDAGTYAVRFAPGPTPAGYDRQPRFGSGKGGPPPGDGPVLGPEYEAELRENEAAWSFFNEQRPAYRRAAIWWVVGAAHEETRRRRLATLVETSARGERLPQVTRNL